MGPPLLGFDVSDKAMSLPELLPIVIEEQGLSRNATTWNRASACNSSCLGVFFDFSKALQQLAVTEDDPLLKIFVPFLNLPVMPTHLKRGQHQGTNDGCSKGGEEGGEGNAHWLVSRLPGCPQASRP